MTGTVIRQIGKYVAVFAVTVAVLTALLVLSALIPKSALKKNMLKSAEYLMTNDDQFRAIEGNYGSKIDRFADCVILSIAYYHDAKSPFTSVMKSEFYRDKTYRTSENLKDTVENDVPPNKEYLRYWHGPTLIIRLFHLVTDLKGMYVTHTVLFVLLWGLLSYQLIRRKCIYEAVAFSVALICVCIWFVFVCIEYYWMFLVMFVVSVIAVELTERGRDDLIPVLLLLSGIVANFLDFLTCETITVSVPLMFVVFFRRKRGAVLTKKDVKDVILSAGLWFAGFCCMWVSKWGLAAIALRTDVMPYVTEHVVLRLDGDLKDITPLAMYIGSVYRNIARLFPFEYGALGVIFLIVVVTAAIYRLYVYHDKGADRTAVIIYASLGFITYIRYLVLHSHSFEHFFFTYRSQVATVFAIALIIGEYTSKGKRHENEK